MSAAELPLRGLLWKTRVCNKLESLSREISAMRKLNERDQTLASVKRKPKGIPGGDYLKKRINGVEYVSLAFQNPAGSIKALRLLKTSSSKSYKTNNILYENAWGSLRRGAVTVPKTLGGLRLLSNLWHYHRLLFHCVKEYPKCSLRLPKAITDCIYNPFSERIAKFFLEDLKSDKCYTYQKNLLFITLRKARRIEKIAYGDVPPP